MEILAKLGIDWKLLLAQGVNFLILLYVLKRFAYKPMLEFLHARSERIEQGLKDADLAKTKLVEISAEEEKVLGLARTEAKALIGEAEKQAKESAKKREEMAEQKVAQMLSEGEKRIEEERMKALSAAKAEVADLVTATLEKVLSEKIDGQKDQELISRLTR
jgi:F-type H+-transporting ATPase subunit b